MIHYSVIENVSGVVCPTGKNAMLYSTNPECVDCDECKKRIFIGRLKDAVVRLDMVLKAA